MLALYDHDAEDRATAEKGGMKVRCFDDWMGKLSNTASLKGLGHLSL